MKKLAIFLGLMMFLVAGGISIWFWLSELASHEEVPTWKKTASVTIKPVPEVPRGKDIEEAMDLVAGVYREALARSAKGELIEVHYFLDDGSQYWTDVANYRHEMRFKALLLYWGKHDESVSTSPIGKKVLLPKGVVLYSPVCSEKQYYDPTCQHMVFDLKEPGFEQQIVFARPKPGGLHGELLTQDQEPEKVRTLTIVGDKVIPKGVEVTTKKAAFYGEE